MGWRCGSDTMAAIRIDDRGRFVSQSDVGLIAGIRLPSGLASLIETCKLNGVEPYAYLQDILTLLVAGHPVNRLGELLAWNWRAAMAASLTLADAEASQP
ncbi:transposase IS66-like protein [Zavarzinia compransoris]|nr:transposase IS66-like protein [Zavarzinia compransoris]